MPLQSINPATEEEFKSFDELSDQQVKEKIDIAQKAFKSWKNTSFAERAEKMQKLAELLKQNSREYGEIMTKEMGKPITGAIGEAEKCAWAAEYYAQNAEKFLAEEKIEVEKAQKTYVRFDPLGIVLAVMPWNFPFWQVIRAAAPALMAGNVMLLKHASNVPFSGVTLEKLFLEAGFPEGVFQNLLIGSSKVAQVIEDPRVKAATLTGSEYAGSKVAEACGREIKPTVLELGGSDPFIVLADAEIKLACENGVNGRFRNSGQSCIAAKRFIIVEERYDEFVEEFKNALEAEKLGDPMDESTTIGPLATKSIFDDIVRQVDESVAQGARIVAGGKRRGDKGYFYESTILADVTTEMPAFREETFGPVAACIRARDEAHALKLANDSDYGLGASIWTQNTAHAEELARHIDSGSVYINNFVQSHPHLPFGGVKKSGYGRELSHYGIKEFVNAKTIWVA